MYVCGYVFCLTQCPTNRVALNTETVFFLFVFFKEGVGKKEEQFFSLLFPGVFAAGVFIRVATFHFLLCIFVCVSVHLYVACMCELCEGLVLRWWFIATGSGPICFRSVSCSVLASLQHSPSWPDTESGWDPFKSAWNEHGIHMRAHTHKPLSLTLLSPSAFFSLNSTNSRKHPAPTHSNSEIIPSHCCFFCSSFAISLAYDQLKAA